MGILDRLLEKKNVLSYIDKRIEQLKEDQGRAVENTEPRNKELVRQRFKGRIEELRDKGNRKQQEIPRKIKGNRRKSVW